MHSIAIFLAQDLIYILVAAAGLYWLRLSARQKLKLAVFGVITGLLAFALAWLGSKVFYDTRPFANGHVTALIAHSADNGFPSDHMLLASVVAATVWFGSRRLGIGTCALALLVGAGRVLAHVHHVIDIAGSVVFVAAAATVAWQLEPRITARITERKTNRLSKV